MDSKDSKKKILVYSCSGCSSVAQLANTIAVRLDREGIADMSCIAGVGGGVNGLVKLAESADVIIGIDGCQLSCVEACLRQRGLKPTYHYDLSRLGIAKKFHQDPSPDDVENLYQTIVQDLRTKCII
ncbi:MAG: putative zinc-binding protein [Desulfobacterales bacterium]|nr:putative zinc-binding protein [Desulfobacterales bacterium]